MTPYASTSRGSSSRLEDVARRCAARRTQASKLLRAAARKLQAPVSRAAVAGQRSFFGSGDDVPADPKDMALAYMKELKGKMSSAYAEKVTIPDADYKAAVDTIAAEKTRYGLEDIEVEPRKEVSLKDLVEG